MAKGKLRMSGEFLRSYHFGGLDAQILGCEWDDKTHAVVLSIEGPDVPETGGKWLKVEQRKSIETKFVLVPPYVR